jgi:hypothetical protein
MNAWEKEREKESVRERLRLREQGSTHTLDFTSVLIGVFLFYFTVLYLDYQLFLPPSSCFLCLFALELPCEGRGRGEEYSLLACFCFECLAEVEKRTSTVKTTTATATATVSATVSATALVHQLALYSRGFSLFLSRVL